MQAQQYFKSTDGVHKIALYRWEPATAPLGIVQITHGMREHMGRYSGFATFLNSQGYLVYGHDHLGHGQSAGKDGAGHFGERDGFRYLVGDTRKLTLILHRKYPTLPLFLLGHSMGSLVARLSILGTSHCLSGFICMATAGPNAFAAGGQAFAGLLSRMGGTQAPAALLNKLLFGSFQRHFPDGPPNAWLSRDMEVVGKYAEDPYTKPLFTNQAMCDLLAIQTAVTSSKWAQRVDKRLPIFLASGLADPVGDFGKGVVQTFEQLKMAGCLDVSCKLYPECRHELLNEINREEIFFDLYSWMNDRMPHPKNGGSLYC